PNSASFCCPSMTSSSSIAFFTASMALSRLMMLPRRVPFIGAVPLPMISSWPRSVTSPTSTHTFDVPMSSATMYFSSVFGMDILLIGDLHGDDWTRSHRHCRHRSQRLHHHSAIEAKIGIGDVARRKSFRCSDRIKFTPLRGEV